jgi:hypothetical protein
MSIEIYYNDYSRRYEVSIKDAHGRLDTLSLTAYMHMMRMYRKIVKEGEKA